MTDDSQAPRSDQNVVLVVGNSMYPTLRHLDLVLLDPGSGRPARKGDVIVFVSPSDGKKVVHRVVAVTPEGLLTRGDGSKHRDKYVVPYDSVIGIVAQGQRSNRRWRVRGGPVGQCIGRWKNARVHLSDLVKRVTYPAYRFLYRAGVFRGLLPGGMKPRILAVETPNGVEKQMYMGRRIVGTLPAGSIDWYIKPPFRLFIDESILAPPGGRTCQSEVGGYDSKR